MYRYDKSEKVAAPPLAFKRLLDQVRERIHHLHYSLKKDNSSLYSVRFLFFSAHINDGMRYPKKMGSAEVEAFLTMLANERQLSPSTHRQAFKTF